MKEEIKDILELLRDGVKRPVVTLPKYSLDNICELNPNECKKLLEYIENLQSQLKAKEDNWNYIKKMLKEARNEEFNINGYCGNCTDVDIDFLLDKMEELEILSKGKNK